MLYNFNQHLFDIRFTINVTKDVSMDKFLNYLFLRLDIKQSVRIRSAKCKSQFILVFSKQISHPSLQACFHFDGSKVYLQYKLFEIRTSDFKPWHQAWCPAYDILLKIMELKLRPSENSLVNFCTSALMNKALQISLLYSKKKQMVKLLEMQKCKSLLENLHMVST